MEFLTASRQDNGVELITLNRPPMNAMSAELLTEIADTAERLATDADLKAVVITGNPKVFAAGADISQVLSDDRPKQIAAFRRACDSLTRIPRPVIAAISGFALGGGLEVALACDMRIASESARVGVPEIQLGVFPGAGGTQRLTRVIGAAKTKELIWTGRHVKADEALALGLVDQVVPVDGYLEAALDYAGSLAGGAVVAMGLSKLAIDEGFDLPLSDALDVELKYFNRVMETEDAKAGLTSFFENGPGKATFHGR
jgi:enoyl-CoA hydratase